jgi:hypothetical protein
VNSRIFSLKNSAEVREAQHGKSRPKLWTGLGRGSTAARVGHGPNSHSGLFSLYEQ